MARVNLHADMFAADERVLVEHGAWRASTFRYRSGVAGLRVADGEREAVLLPYQGQQVWNARLGGRDLAMLSMFDQPQPTQDFLRTYGGFVVHCGVTAMGPPGPGDTHPPHGELPNAPFQSAWLELGAHGGKATVALSGSYRHTVGFNTNYVATPTAVFTEGKDRIAISLAVENRKQTPMELMYLAHINFRPIDGSELHQSALPGPDHQRVRRSVPSHVRTAAGYPELVDALGKDPSRHYKLTPGIAYDPEVVFSIDYLADPDGWAMSLQRLPDGSADFVRHRPAELRHGVRWMSRTPDQDCLGLVLPATAETDGLLAERAKGNVLMLAGRDTFRCQYEIGVLDKDDAAEAVVDIEALISGGEKASVALVRNLPGALR
jgi:hypothetical protein